LNHDDLDCIRHFKSEAKNISLSKCDKLVLFVGPCSIHDPDGLLFFAKKLKSIQNVVEDKIFIVLRAHVEKPRTLFGWKGFLVDPQLSGQSNINLGLDKTRGLFLQLLKLKIPISLEILNPIYTNYYDDLITWAFIGARTSSSQIHREIASSLDMPVSFKNNTDGNIMGAIQSMKASNLSHVFPKIDDDLILNITESLGNPYTNLVLRGSDFSSNYEKEHLFEASQYLSRHDLVGKVIVDCAHGNSQKKPDKQYEVFKEVVDDFITFQTPLMGIMLESYIQKGSQNHEKGKKVHPHISITDPCIDITALEELIFYLYEKLNQNDLYSSSVYMKSDSAE
jgi:3-deoxy-7-phosphoheptulonate synthase